VLHPEPLIILLLFNQNIECNFGSSLTLRHAIKRQAPFGALFSCAQDPAPQCKSAWTMSLSGEKPVMAPDADFNAKSLIRHR
jgi:hypothetical protein